MSKPRSIQEILIAAGGIAFISRMMGLGYTTVLSWSGRNSIPPEYWSRLQLLAVASGNEIASDELIAAHSSPALEALLVSRIAAATARAAGIVDLSQNARKAS